MNGGNEFKADTTVLIFSAISVLVAATLTMATITNSSNKGPGIDPHSLSSPDPMKKAEAAARDGIDHAKFHIECHGRIAPGGIARRYDINGGIYSVEWESVNLADSTVVVHSVGEFSWGGDKVYRARVSSKVKLDFLPPHGEKILDGYYTENIGITRQTGG